MIVVDTSALVAIVFAEPRGPRCLEILNDERRVLISAGTLSEALVVSGRKNIARAMQDLLDILKLDVVPVTDRVALQVADAYSRWGKGVNPARLNLGDCFAYALAREYGCPLLYIGDDFAKTDIVGAL